MSRTRQLMPAVVFEHLFDHVYQQCVARKLVAGEQQVSDSALIKANASLDSLRPKQLAAFAPILSLVDKPVLPPTPHLAAVLLAHAHHLRREATRQACCQKGPGHLGTTHAKARLVSNKLHYSPTEPEARISGKPGKLRVFNYLCSMAVDTAHGVISHVQADLAESRDSVHLPRLLTGLQQRLRTQQLYLREVLADAGYANGPNYALLEQQPITAWILIFGKYKPEVEGFSYHAPTDTYQCPAGKQLAFAKVDTTADGSWVKLYRAIYKDCRQCPLKATCIPKGTYKQLTRTIYGGPYRRAWQRQQNRRGRRMR